ncbi:e3 ubiquitin-protein ligase atl23-like [Stylonychia lemnae]|uniref:E3 ubiquitin-protein ligase atl23-like n=1 Tax=Stylonychia lemnae TaxID=5949 RepID=A0A078B0J5_STYLE|nr:e3 ubiquitin-protein ligase atl23-like [Stylonychia lemnae]|eukprot:CDW87831.1 e3 ubiquitin-protein ligase atl23-like [Stylonychia lemnae]
MISYLDILLIRSFFFFFELNARFMKCSAIAILFIILPFHTLWTFLGTGWYSDMMKNESTCLKNTRFKVVFQSFNDEQNNDQLINNFLNENLLNNLDQDRMDPSMRPLNDRDLKKIKLHRASITEQKENEICSICCDEIQNKQKIRKMPECKHGFHQNCIDNWLKMKPTCPNCNRKTRDILQFN